MSEFHRAILTFWSGALFRNISLLTLLHMFVAFCIFASTSFWIAPSMRTSFPSIVPSLMYCIWPKGGGSCAFRMCGFCVSCDNSPRCILSSLVSAYAIAPHSPTHLFMTVVSMSTFVSSAYSISPCGAHSGRSWFWCCCCFASPPSCFSSSWAPWPSAVSCLVFFLFSSFLSVCRRRSFVVVSGGPGIIKFP